MLFYDDSVLVKKIGYILQNAELVKQISLSIQLIIKVVYDEKGHPLNSRIRVL